jgi:hypothetical protein
MVQKPTQSFYDIKNLLEKNQVVKDLIAFIKLPVREQQRIFDLWEKYYEDVKGTTQYQLYQAMREAYAKRNFGRFKELQAEMQQMQKDEVIPELKKPPYVEPLTMYNDQLVIRYRNVLQEIKREMSSGASI